MTQDICFDADTYCLFLFLIYPFCVQTRKATPLESETFELQGTVALS